MDDFYPISPLVGITNTSYAAQAGVMDEKWAVRVVRGKKIIAEKTINNLDLESVVGVIYGHIRLEGLSRHAVAMCAGRLMQFARKYQQAGVCPNFEVPDLVRTDGSKIGSTTVTVESSESTSEDLPAPTPESAPAEDTSIAHLGHVPKLQALGGKNLWRECARSRALLLLNMAIYSAELPKGHIEAMFDRVIEDRIREWSASGNAEDVLVGFVKEIQSCSDENQVPITTQGASIETGSCMMMTVAHEIDPERKRIPSGYPCAYHEALAKRVSEITGVNILVNASSNGCRVLFSVE